MDSTYHVTTPISTTDGFTVKVGGTVILATPFSFPAGTTVSCNVSPCPGVGVCSICGARTGS